MRIIDTSYDKGHRHRVAVPAPPPDTAQLALRTSYDKGHRHGLTLDAQRLRDDVRQAAFTTYDKGHRHMVLAGLGQHHGMGLNVLRQRPPFSGFGQAGVENGATLPEVPGLPPMTLPDELPGGFLSPEACASKVAQSTQAARAEGKQERNLYALGAGLAGIAVGALVMAALR